MAVTLLLYLEISMVKQFLYNLIVLRCHFSLTGRLTQMDFFCHMEQVWLTFFYNIGSH